MVFGRSFTTIRLSKYDLKADLDMWSIHHGHSSFSDYLNKRVSYKKESDTRYNTDNTRMVKRLCTDAYSEVMIYHFSGGIYKPNFEVGQSKKYNLADFSHIGINMGLKSASIENCHLIQKPEKVKYPELLVHIDSKNAYVDYIIHGVASIEVMKEHGSEDLVLSPTARNYKNGFDRYNLCMPIYSFAQLKQ